MSYLSSYFVKDLVKLRKPLQQKFKKEVSWTWTPSNSKIVQHFKSLFKNLPVLNMPNERNDLILEIDVSHKHSSAVPKIKGMKNLCKYCNGSVNKA